MNLLLNHIIKFRAGTDLKEIEKLIFGTQKSHKLLNQFSSLFGTDSMYCD